jgi:hypothetical protein
MPRSKYCKYWSSCSVENSGDTVGVVWSPSQTKENYMEEQGDQCKVVFAVFLGTTGKKG